VQFLGHSHEITQLTQFHAPAIVMPEQYHWLCFMY